MPTATTKTKVNTVVGIVSDAAKRPLSNLKVEIYDVNMRSRQVLSDTITTGDGRYELSWSQSQLTGRERKTADIAVKVSTIEKGTELFTSGMDEVRFNAGVHERIDIIIWGQVPVETVEFDFLVKEVNFQADKVAIADLQETKENRDITFLSKELEVSAEKLEHLVVAHRLQKISKADADFFYALLRKNTLLGSNAGRIQARNTIGIGDDEEIILLDASLVDKNKIEADIKSAVADHLVSSRATKNLRQNIQALSRNTKKAEDYYEKEHPGKVIELLTNILNPAKIIEVQQLFQENKNDLDNFLEKVSDPAFINSKGKTENGKLNEGLNRLFDFGKIAITNIIKETKVKKEKDIRKLARFNKAKWIEELERTNPKIKDSSIVSIYASSIVRRFEKAFPTTAFAAQLERSSKTVLKNQNEIVRFLNKYEDFDLSKNNVDLFLKEKKVEDKNVDLISDELKSMQRVFRLVPNYSKAMALRDEKIHSAFNIVSIGKSRFTKEIAPKAGLSDEEAIDIFHRAEVKHTAAILTIGDLHDSITAMDIAALDNDALAKKIEAVSKDFPNLKSLFKLTDICECEHCRSVYSPAAYLVEVLQFLDKRTVVAGNAKTVLFNISINLLVAVRSVPLRVKHRKMIPY